MRFKKMCSILFHLFVVFVLILHMTGCGKREKTYTPYTQKSEKKWSIIRISMPSFPVNFNPLMINEDTAGVIQQFTMKRLIGYDKHLDYIPELLENYDVYYLVYDPDKFDFKKLKNSFRVNLKDASFSKILNVIEKFPKPKKSYYVNFSGNWLLAKLKATPEAEVFNKAKIFWREVDGWWAYFPSGIEEFVKKKSSFYLRLDGIIVMIVEFNLRKGLKWSDGREFTADDVEATVLAGKSIRNLYTQELSFVSEIQKKGKYNVKLCYSRPDASILSVWVVSPLPRSVWKSGQVDLAVWQDLKRVPFGIGPYKFKGWISEREVALVKNPIAPSFSKTPSIDEVHFLFIQDSDMVFSKLLSGDIDIAEIDWQYFEKLKGNSHFRMYRQPDWGYTYVGFNLDDLLLKDIHLRQALVEAVDKEKLVKEILHGFAQPVWGPILPESWAYNPDVEKVGRYNPEHARDILINAGWKDVDGDGYLEKNGKKVELTLLTNKGNRMREKVANFLVNEWKKIGIKVRVKLLEWNDFLTNHVDKRNFQMILLGWSLTPEPELYPYWHSSQIPTKEHFGYNAVGFRSKEADKLMDELRFTLDRSKRKIKIQKVQYLIVKEFPYLFLYRVLRIWAVNDKIKGIEPTPVEFFYEPERWTISE